MVLSSPRLNCYISNTKDLGADIRLVNCFSTFRPAALTSAMHCTGGLTQAFNYACFQEAARELVASPCKPSTAGPVHGPRHAFRIGQRGKPDR
jgi:hypothetical protein